MTEDAEKELDAVAAQLQHSYEALRALATLAIQMCGFIIAADTLLLAYGLSQRQAGFLLIASAMPQLIALLSALVIAHGFPMVYVALRAERRLAPNADTLCSTYLAIRAPSILRKLNEHLDQNDSPKSMSDLRRLASARRFIDFRSPGMVILEVGWISQVVLFVLALCLFNYRLF
ncbi:hypothetical protein ABJI51_34560 [Amycolatopsis sp. NEAU-NG30]|uniref:Uncharacterized protein n=1 Tax=Amycolatopsis melonis TaxID=3156488 RepID=A0ABV0LPM8_9PSEU